MDPFRRVACEACLDILFHVPDDVTAKYGCAGRRHVVLINLASHQP